MKTFLTNDDGINSPLLKPFLETLKSASLFSELRFVIPDGERSWVSQAASRFGSIEVKKHSLSGVDGFLCSGTPADCSYLGIDNLFEFKPELIISGINIGVNAGLPYYLSSGTVGAARAGALRGIPSIAVSAHLPSEIFMIWHKGDPNDFKKLSSKVERLSENTFQTIEALIKQGLVSEADFYSINIPWDEADKLELRFTEMEAGKLGKVFLPNEDGTFRHDFQGTYDEQILKFGDMSTVKSGHISITPYTYRNGMSHQTNSIKPGDLLLS